MLGADRTKQTDFRAPAIPQHAGKSKGEQYTQLTFAPPRQTRTPSQHNAACMRASFGRLGVCCCMAARRRLPSCCSRPCCVILRCLCNREQCNQQLGCHKSLLGTQLVPLAGQVTAERPASLYVQGLQDC